MDRSLIRAVCNPCLAIWHYRVIQQFLICCERAGNQQPRRHSADHGRSISQSFNAGPRAPTVKQQMAAILLLCALPPLAKPANCRAGRLCAPTPRTCLNEGSNKPDSQRILPLTPSARPVSRIFSRGSGIEPRQNTQGTPSIVRENLPAKAPSRRDEIN